MRNLPSILALAAVLGAGLPQWGPAFAQDAAAVSPDVAARLRDAVARAGAGTTPGADATLPAPTLTAAQLDELVAPIALYPDSLLAQVLVASTFPDQIVAAERIIAGTPGFTDSQLDDALAARQWDPSISVLMSGFPSVISRMAQDMDWTDRLGAAVTSQDPDVLAAVQRMRSKAAAAGNLTSNRAQTVSHSGTAIAIRPTNPDVVYVPQYDPAAVYATPNLGYAGTLPAAPSASSSVSPFVAGALGFGAGLLVANLFHHDDDNNNNGWHDYWSQGAPVNWQNGWISSGPGGRPWTPPPPPARWGGPVPPPLPRGGSEVAPPPRSGFRVEAPEPEHRPEPRDIAMPAPGEPPRPRPEAGGDQGHQLPDEPDKAALARANREDQEAKQQELSREKAEAKQQQTQDARQQPRPDEEKPQAKPQEQQDQEKAKECRKHPDDPACK